MWEEPQLIEMEQREVAPVQPTIGECEKCEGVLLNDGLFIGYERKAG